MCTQKSWHQIRLFSTINFFCNLAATVFEASFDSFILFILLSILSISLFFEFPKELLIFLAELQRAKRASEAPWVRKIGNPSS